jgi:hypothetical protein
LVGLLFGQPGYFDIWSKDWPPLLLKLKASSEKHRQTVSHLVGFTSKIGYNFEKIKNPIFMVRREENFSPTNQFNFLQFFNSLTSRMTST